MYEIYQRLLDEKGLKNSDVSKGTGISNMTLSDWKHGKTTPKTETMRKIALFLNVSVDYLTNGVEPEYTFEMSQQDLALSNMDNRMKEYALKMNKLSHSEQELIMQMIDKLSEK